jgi:hypothetical protein
MNLSPRDRKLLALWAVLVALGVGYYFFWPEDTGKSAALTATKESVELAEQRLMRLRNIAATAPARQSVLEAVSAELATREQGLLRAATVQQAQAQMIGVLRELLGQETPALEIRSMDLLAVEPLGDDYGLTPVRVQFECRLSQLLNILAAMAARPQLITTRDLQITAGNPREKTIRVLLTVVGVVPKELVPDTARKGGAR